MWPVLLLVPTQAQLALDEDNHDGDIAAETRGDLELLVEERLTFHEAERDEG